MSSRWVLLLRVVTTLMMAVVPMAVGERAVVASPAGTGVGTGRNHAASSGVLKQASAPLLWSGRVGPEDAPEGGEPPECAEVPCDRFRLKVDLPHGTFRNPNRPGGVQVALRWFGNPAGHTLPPGVPGCCGEFDTLHLWIYKDGALIAASPGIIAVSQSAFIPEAANGWYDVWIAYDPVLQRRAGRRVRGARRSRVPARTSGPSNVCCPTWSSAARSGLPSTRRRFRSSSPSRRRDRAASSARCRRTGRRTASASTRSSPTEAAARSKSRSRSPGASRRRTATNTP